MRRRGALAGIALLCASALAACAGGGGGRDAAVSIKTLQAAASNTQAAESTSFTMEIAVSVGDEEVQFHGSGVAAADGHYGEATLDMGPLGTLEERITPDGLYLKLGELSGGGAGLPDGKSWVFMSYEAIERETGTNLRELTEQSAQNSPQQGLDYLRSAGDVTEIGPDTVGGAPATHYRAVIDYERYAEEHLADATPEARARMAKLGEVPADVWIDGQDRIVKMEYSMDAAAFGGKTGSARMTMEITGFGVPVDVQAPPADETVDFSEVGSLNV